MREKAGIHNGKEALKEGVSQLINLGHDSRTAWLEAGLLLGKAWHKNKIKLLTTLEEVLETVYWENYLSYINRRLLGEPLQYILEEQTFMSLCFKVSPDVLIPRQETEILVNEALRAAGDNKRVQILDLCTGSGAIAVSLAYYLADCQVSAVDVSDSALEVARTNACLNGVEDRLRFYCGDMFMPLPDKRFDIITCNPPYISAAEYKELSADVKKEPRLALYGGSDGLDFYRVIGENAHKFLKKKGVLLLEIGYNQGADVKNILEKSNFKNVRVMKDWNEHDRIVTCTAEAVMIY